MAGEAQAQDMQPLASVLGIEDPEYEPRAIQAGGFELQAGGTARIEYDSNIYAQEFGEKDDLKLIVQPQLQARMSKGPIEIAGDFNLNGRKYLQYESEDALAGEAEVRLGWQPNETQRAGMMVAYRHVVEDRGEPEGRIGPRLGPRELDMLDGELEYSHSWSRFGVLLNATGSRFRYDDAIDRDRDLDRYAALVRLSYRVSGTVNVFGEGSAGYRNFRFDTPGEPTRDAATYSGQVGVAITPGGALRGEAAAGIYRFSPRSSLRPARTGFSAQASMVYQPRQRTAFLLEAFAGDVATYRAGAQSRQDVRVRFGVQQELFHNLRAQASAIYRRSSYFGTGIRENTYAGMFELEYLARRNVRLGAQVSLAKRDSEAVFEDFERARIALQLKVTL
jgi:Uncharacterized protein conserved in bacteria